MYVLPHSCIQAHDGPIRSMKWSHNGEWMVTTDDRGFVKYWQSNFNNVHTFQAHSEPIRCSRWDSAVSLVYVYISNSIGSSISSTVELLVNNIMCACVCRKSVQPIQRVHVIRLHVDQFKESLVLLLLLDII